MRKFLRETYAVALNPPREADESFNSLQFSSKTSCCSYESYCKYDEKVLKLRTFAERNNVHSDYTIVPDLIYLMTPVYKETLSSHENTEKSINLQLSLSRCIHFVLFTILFVIQEMHYGWRITNIRISYFSILASQINQLDHWCKATSWPDFEVYEARHQDLCW